MTHVIKIVYKMFQSFTYIMSLTKESVTRQSVEKGIKNFFWIVFTNF